MALRKFNFDEDDPAKANEALRAAVEAKQHKFVRQAAKLVVDEKRWLRKKRLANTKLKKINTAKRRLRARIKAFDKTTKKAT